MSCRARPGLGRTWSLQLAGIEEFCDELGLTAPAALRDAYASVSSSLQGVVYEPHGQVGDEGSIDSARAVAESSPWPLPHNLIPIMACDDISYACVLASPADDDAVPGEGAVVRWHLTTEKPEHQAAVLDTAADTYLASVAEELSARDEGLHRMLDEIGPWYELNYLDEAKRPRDFVLRPVRLACQNVILAYAAFCQDSSFDGLSVIAWQACELSHVATHEGNRALTAMMLCDAYQSGGTMEIRFDRPQHLDGVRADSKSGRLIDVPDRRYPGHPEMKVPASLRRYARTVGIDIEAPDAEHPQDPGYLSPSESRELFFAVTPMADDLAMRVETAAASGVASPERLCFTLLSGVWRDVELDFMLAVSERSGDILRGGSSWQSRPQRQAEAQVARASLMAGMLYGRLDTKDAAGADGQARVLEDNRVGVTWSVIEDIGAIAFGGLRAEQLPWQQDSVATEDDGDLVVLPRATPTASDVATVRSLSERALAAMVVPSDADLRGLATDEIHVMRCPDRRGELDLMIEGKLLTSRIARA